MTFLKSFFLLIIVGIIIIACKKNESAETSTTGKDSAVWSQKDTVNLNRSELDKIIDSTFEPISQIEYDTIRENYDLLFAETILKRKDFEIDKESFNKTIDLFRGNKKYVDIYFILDSEKKNNLVFKFTDKQDLIPNYLLENGDKQYIIEDKKLISADDQNLKKMVDDFTEKYIEQAQSLNNSLHTVVVRDIVDEIHTAHHNIILEPCINRTNRVSLATQMTNDSGTIEYFNRGALWP